MPNLTPKHNSWISCLLKRVGNSNFLLRDKIWPLFWHLFLSMGPKSKYLLRLSYLYVPQFSRFQTPGIIEAHFVTERTVYFHLFWELTFLNRPMKERISLFMLFLSWNISFIWAFLSFESNILCHKLGFNKKLWIRNKLWLGRKYKITIIYVCLKKEKKTCNIYVSNFNACE